MKLNENTQNVAEHEEFSRSLLDLEGWLKATQEKMAACGGVSGQGNGDGVSTDIEVFIYLL